MITKTNTINVLVCIYLISIFLTYTYDSLFYHGLRLFLGMLFYVFSFSKRKNINQNLKVIFILSIVIFFGLISHVYSNNGELFRYFITIGSFGGVALILLNYPVDTRFMRVAYYVPVIYFARNLIIGSSPNQILTSSQNYISVLLLYFLIVLFIANSTESSNMGFFLLIVAFIFSVWASGRGGIITFSFIIVAKLLMIVKASNSRNEKIRGLLLIFIVLVFSIFFMSEYSDLLFSRFYDRGFIEGTRRDLWLSYLENLIGSVENFVFGVNLNTIPLISIFGHMHNSFFMLHAQYGFFVFTLIMFFLFKTLILLIRNRQYDLAIIMIAFLIRSFTDVLFANSYGDIFLFYFVFYTFFHKKTQAKSQLEKQH